MKIDSTVVRTAETYVRDYLSKHLNNDFGFHDIRFCSYLWN